MFLSDLHDKTSEFDVGGGPKLSTSLLEVLDSLKAEFAWRTEVTDEDCWEGDQKVYGSDISCARQHLDWATEVDFEGGINRDMDWLETVDQ